MSEIRPIWKDIEYTTSADTLVYGVKVDGNKIYSGKAYKYPNAAELKININKICQDYLSIDLPDIRTYSASTYTHENALKTFVLVDSADTQLQTYDFLYNWDYELNKDFSGTTILSEPINGHSTGNMKIMQTVCTSGGVYTSISSGSGFGYEDKYCGDYALIYSNCHGGFDSFLIEGNTKVSDDIESQEFNRPYNNTTIDFEKKRFISQITTSLEMHTGILTDEQSEILATNLIPTNMLYVQKISTNEIYPALIKDTTVEHKKFINGRKLNMYTINIEISQTKLRK